VPRTGYPLLDLIKVTIDQTKNFQCRQTLSSKLLHQLKKALKLMDRQAKDHGVSKSLVKLSSDQIHTGARVAILKRI